MIRTLSHSFGSFFRGLARSPFRSFGIISLLSTLFFVMFLLMMFSSLTGQSISVAEKKVDLLFFIQKDTPEHKISLLKAELLHMEKRNEIEEFSYTSEAEALQIFAEKYPERFSFWKRNIPDENPLSASFEVIPNEKSIDELSAFFASEAFMGIIDVPRMQKTIEARERGKKILEFLQFLEKGITLLIGIILVSIAGVTTAFISSSFLLRQKEIFIMRLVGAPYSFIRAPFLVEGVAFTAIALGIGWGLFFTFRDFALSKMFGIFASPQEAKSTVEMVNTLWQEFMGTLPEIIIIILVSALLVSFLSIERLLRKKRILQ